MSDADILAKLARWVRQNPEANAGDHAGQELLDLVRSIRGTSSPDDELIRCVTCHRMVTRSSDLEALAKFERAPLPRS